MQAIFLEEITAADQKVRQEAMTVLHQYGHDSPEERAAGQRVMVVDELNLRKVEAYLERYGHPTITAHGMTASRTPYLVIHHSDPRLGARERNFPYLYRAYKNGDLDGGALAFYLNRFHAHRFGERLKIEGAFREEMEIDTLIGLLGLTIPAVEPD